MIFMYACLFVFLTLFACAFYFLWSYVVLCGLIHYIFDDDDNGDGLKLSL